MQSLTLIQATETLQNSLTEIINNDITAISQSAGTAFPTANLYIGMPCFRTDQNKLYMLKDLTPTWVLTDDLSRVPAFLDSPAFTGNPQGVTGSVGDNSVMLATNQFVMNALRNMTSVPISGAGVTLTTAQCGTQIIKFTGTLTANAIATLPAATGSWVVYNGTTGAYTLTIKTASGSGVTLAQNQSNAIWCDGTNVYAEQTDFSNIGSLTASALNTSGALTVNGAGDNGGNGGQIRLINANYGVILRNDGTTMCLMQTASGSQSGTWNAYRPLSWNLSTGALTLDGSGAGATFGGAVTMSGLTSNGAAAVNGVLNLTDTSTSDQASLVVKNTNNTGCGAGIMLIGNGATTPNKTMRVLSGAWQIVNSAYNAVILNLDDAGNMTANGNVTAYSDERLKEDFEKVDGALAKVNALTGWTFTRKDTGEVGIGVKAQEVAAVQPELVHEDKEGYLSVAYGNMAALFIEAIKELSAELADVKAKLKELEGQV